ncbi:hypothetical protein [Variovorax sp. UMC13]|uniref:hypothetical protein n=1 Tax=Variovorax sp. UMC13 TaxID=1862326 RepID=UPI00160426A4|nr:hypothetical protein [Variovorax sp. UMC13]MBB1601774.1 hypothetical protein [Variovorax sp. UMC13]
MSFLQNLSTFGTIETTRSYSHLKHLDLATRLRVNFINNAKRQIAEVESDAVLSTNAWVSKKSLGGGKVQYKVSLRVGPRLIQLPGGGTHIVIDAKEKVIKFLEGVVAACDEGELDELLQQTSGKGKGKERTASEMDEAPMSS